MKKIALLTGLVCAIGSGAAQAQDSRTVVIIPAFQNRFAGIHEPVIALNTIDRSSGFQQQTFGGSSSFTTDPAARGVVTSPTANATRRSLDATTMNIPVFPGTPVFGPGTTFGPRQVPLGAFPNTGVGAVGGAMLQQGAGGSSLAPVDPFRTTATPGPAVNAVPNPAAPVPTIPQLQPNTGTTIPVHQQNPPVIQAVPGGSVVSPAAPSPIQPQQVQPNGPAGNTGTGTEK